MSILKAKNVQIGNDLVANNNFTLYQPPVPDGTMRIAIGNPDGVKTDIMSWSNTGVITVTSGVFSVTGNTQFEKIDSTPIGQTTPAAGAFTSLLSTANTTIGNTSNDVLTINGSSIVLANTATISGNANFTGTLGGIGLANYLASPSAIGASTANTGSFTTLTTSSTVTLNGGTANGVGYLNASKVLTTGSALTFNGTNLGIGVNSSGQGKFQINASLGTTNDSAIRITDNATTSMFFNNTASGVSSIWSSGALAFGVASSNPFTEQMRLTSTGLGIGTNSPQFKLNSVQGITGAAPSVTSAIQVYAKGYGGSGQQYAGIGFAMNEHTNGYWGSGILARDDSGSYGSALSFYVSTGSATPTPTEAMRISSSGNLGLGVTPSAWGSGKAIELGQVTGNALWGLGINSLYLTSNARWNGSNYVYTNNGAANLYGAGTGNGTFTWFTAPSGTAGNAISFGDPKMTLTAAGDLLTGGKTSTTANGGDVQVSRGVTFPATQVACADSNTLDDYEEGTWTPTLSFGSGSVTYSHRTGHYTKTGNVVTVVWWVRLSAVSSPAGSTIALGPLPFAVGSGDARPAAALRSYGLSGVTGVVGGWSTGGNSGLSLVALSNGNSTDLNASCLVSGAEINGTFTYIT